MPTTCPKFIDGYECVKCKRGDRIVRMFRGRWIVWCVNCGRELSRKRERIVKIVLEKVDENG